MVEIEIFQEKRQLFLFFELTTKKEKKSSEIFCLEKLNFFVNIGNFFGRISKISESRDPRLRNRLTPLAQSTYVVARVGFGRKAQSLPLSHHAPCLSSTLKLKPGVHKTQPA